MKDFLKYFVWAVLFWTGISFIIEYFSGGFLQWVGIICLGVWLNWTWDKLNK